MKIAITLTYMIIFVNAYPNYFTYNDCDPECSKLNQSCTITEVQGDFPKVCYTSPNICEEEADSWTVCLRLNEPPVGGENIWNDFKQRFYPTTTTTPMPPEMNVKCLTFEILSIIQFIIIISAITMMIILYIKYKKRNNNYDNLQQQSDDNPY